MTTNQQRLNQAANILAKYFGVPNIDDVVGAISLAQISGQGYEKWKDLTAPNKIELALNEEFIDSLDGAYKSNDLINRLKEFIKNNADAKDLVHERFQVFFTESNLVEGTKAKIGNGDSSTIWRPGINTMLAKATGQATGINDNIANPSKESPAASVVLSNSTRMSISNRSIVPATIFLNGIPNVEMNRAVPFVNIEFFFPKTALNKNNQIQSLSMVKFLEGSKKVPDKSSPLELLARAGETDKEDIASTKQPASEVYSSAGMELFTSPQTLVNADENFNSELRRTPVLDKFRPFMTMKSLEISVRPTGGLMSYKSATLSLVLHDRSRLADIAEFVRADLYGKTEILIEYGWSHPDGDNDRNPYGMLINAMRVKEKYGVYNSSFTFDEIGQVNITLNLAMRGGIETDTELISSDSDTLGDVMQDVQDLQESIGKYRDIVFKDTDTTKFKEIRGIQILNAAQDAVGNITMGQKLKNTLGSFKREMKKSPSPDAEKLIEALDGLLGTEGEVEKLRKTVVKSVGEKIKELTAQENDPFRSNRLDEEVNKGKRNVTNSGEPKWRDGKGIPAKFRKHYNGLKDVLTGRTVSLGKLLLFFVLEPLARSKKFDDIQMFFYPFNSCAGKAHQDNIANFSVDVDYFVRLYHDYRLNHLSKSGNMSLAEFLNFVTEMIIDDPAAGSYGLIDKGKAFHKNVFDEKGQIKAGAEPGKNETVPSYQQRINSVLKDETPNGEFKMPQVEFYIEAVPEKVGVKDNEDAVQNKERTILRIHIFDRQANSYETLGSLMASTRDLEIESLGKLVKPINKAGNEGVQKSTQEIRAATKAAIDQSGLVEIIKDPETGKFTDPPVYGVRGGVGALKEFMMKSMPYIIFGAGGTTVEAANLSSLQDSALGTVNLLRSFGREETDPTGEAPGGLPMRIIPTELNVIAKGCPIINFAQQFFVDFQTGTTADAIYSVIGVVHKFEPGSFKTDIKFAPGDGWGKYINIVQRFENISKILKDIKKDQDKT